MANGQLGTLGNGAQLATPFPPNLDTTKDRQYWTISTSTVGVTTPPNWDRYSAWGIEKGFTSASPSDLQPNKILAIPYWFNRTGTINKILGYFSTALAAPSKMVFALYGNILDGTVWPGAKLAQSSEVTLDSGGSGTVIAWTADYQVTAGTLLWLAVSVGPTNVMQYAGKGAAASEFPCLMGNSNLGAQPLGSLDAGISSVDSAYNAIAPTTFPTTNPVLFHGLGTSDPMPIFTYRFVKS